MQISMQADFAVSYESKFCPKVMNVSYECDLKT